MQSLTTLIRGAITIHAIPVLADNLVYLVCREQSALLVDAGEASPVKTLLESNDLRLTDILITHRHGDHTAGLSALQPLVCKTEAVTAVNTIAVPGHTADDTAFYLPEANVVFTGDALINGACGRAPSTEAIAQLYQSLQRIAALPDDTLVLGGHDYLEENMHFALCENPDCSAARQRLECYQPHPADAIFVTLAEEKRTNPFLQATNADDFTALRQRKDRF